MSPHFIFLGGGCKEVGVGVVDSSIYISVTATLVVRIKLILHKVFQVIPFYNVN